MPASSNFLKEISLMLQLKHSIERRDDSIFRLFKLIFKSQLLNEIS